MLLGTYLPKLDEKGRVILPAKFRDEFAGGVVITRGQERCLYLFSETEFAGIHERARQVPVTGKKSRDFLRLLLSGASQETPDKQNRVTIPPLLRDYAGLERDLTIIGAGNRAEIWDTNAWNNYYTATETEYSDTDEEVIAGIY